jgi:hypothetical protein
MPRAPGRRRPIRGATTLARTTPIATAAGASGTAGKRHQLVHSPPMGSVSTTWLATSGRGSRTVITRITTEHPLMVQRGLVEIAVAVSSAAVPGTTTHRPSTTYGGSPPTTGVAAWASGSGARLLFLESLSLCFVGGWGRSPSGVFEGMVSITDNSNHTGAAIEAHYEGWLMPPGDGHVILLPDQCGRRFRHARGSFITKEGQR